MMPTTLEEPSNPSSFDVRIAGTSQSRRVPQLDAEDLRHTPRSRSLDLLRADTATPLTERTSIDTLATLKGRRISSPMFLASSTGVQPVAENPSFDSGLPFRDTADEEHGSLGCKSRSHMGRNTLSVPSPETRASTMPRYLNGQADHHLKTPSRRQGSTDHLRSKFSMSPVQQSKRSKARISEDRSSSQIATQGLLSHDGSRSTLGNWSHSLGMAARKLQRSALPRKAVEDGQATTNMHSGVKEELVTPERGKGSLRSAASITSIRRFITPSRRSRKVSTTGLVGSRSKAMLKVDDVVVERHPPSASGSDEAGWEDADGRCSRGGTYSFQGAKEASAGPSLCESYLRVPNVTVSKPRGSREAFKYHNARPHRSARVSKELAEQSLKLAANGGQHLSPFLAKLSEAPQGDKITVPPSPREVGEYGQGLVYADGTPCRPETALAPETAQPAPSKLKTLQLLARRPFQAFGKKMREMDVSWWSSRSSRDLPAHARPPSRPEKVAAPEMISPSRRSEDLLSKASPKVCDPSAVAHKSRSVELDRVSLQTSKIVPLRPSNGVPYRKRPMLPDAFTKPITAPRPIARPPQPVAPAGNEVRQVVSASAGQSNAQPRISDLRHPWMKQLQLSSSCVDSQVPSAQSAFDRRVWPCVDVDEPSAVRSIPIVSLTAASVSLAQPTADTAENEVRNQPLRRPPASLLGQSLPIPPRCGRTRASTISSQSSTTSSPSGKVIVSRRSYGQRLRSPTKGEETASIRSVGTSILFTESPPGSPGMLRLMSPSSATRSPCTTRMRSPPTTILLPKYSPHRRGRFPSLHRKPSSAFTDDSEKIEEEEEWIDDGVQYGSTAAVHDLTALRRQLEDVLPLNSRPGFLEMAEATHTLSSLVKTFTGSSGSLSLNASPYRKRDTPERDTSPRGGLSGIEEAEELNISPKIAYLGHLRGRLTSGASLVSTEANSSFDDSEELQKLLDSIMAADLGGSYDTSGSRCDMALLSPFGSPAAYRDSCSSTEKHFSREVQKEEQPTRTAPLPPPPKFLLNDRPISPPDSNGICESVHSHTATESHTPACGNSQSAHWEPMPMPQAVSFRNGTLSTVPTPIPVVYRVCSPTSWGKPTHADSTTAPVSLVDSHLS